MRKIILTSIFSALSVFIFNSCAGIPKDATAVKPFDKQKYLGTWYEIARMDFRFERDLNNVSATYTLNNNGSIKVDNRGYNYKTKEWKQAIGKAKFAGDENEGRLIVSFFGPFYSSYNVIEIDKEYRNVLVAGKNLEYLWLLSREKSMPDEIKQKYIQKAQQIGFKTSELIWTEHNAKGGE